MTLAVDVSAPSQAQQTPPGRITPAEVASIATVLGRDLPVALDPVTTVVGVRAEGTQIVANVQVSQPLAMARRDAYVAAIQRLGTQMLCGEARAFAGFVRRGGSMRLVYTDVAGNVLEATVATCL